MKFKNYDNRELKGLCTVSYKIDGVHAIKTESGYVSKHGKPLYNLPDFEGRVEVFLGNFKETISACRSKSYQYISPEAIYINYIL